jgi:hypothetical protein
LQLLFFVGSNLTIANNSAEEGAGVAILGRGLWGEPFFRIGSSIIAANQASVHPDCVAIDDGMVVSAGANLVGSGMGCSWSGGDMVGSAAEPIDPLLGSLSDNGGRTFTHSLLPGSPAIDRLPASDSRDQRGVARSQGLASDLGAFESNACANSLDDDGDGWTDFPSDPACASATATRERAHCQDGLDNDGDGLVDFDGGASVNDGIPIAAADAECVGKPWRTAETRVACGLGAELAAVLLIMTWRMGRRSTSFIQLG